MDEHLTSAIAGLLLRGELSPEEEQGVLSHALGCEICEKLVKSFDTGTGGDGEGLLRFAPALTRAEVSRDAYGVVLDRVFKSVILESDQLETQRSAASNLADELGSVSRNQQRLLIRNSAKYHVWVLAEELLARSRASWAESPDQAEHLAGLAFEVTENLRASGFRLRLLDDLKAEAWSYIGNCRRIRSDLADAERAFLRAEYYLAQGSGDPMELARLYDLKSSFLRAKRDFNGAADLLGKAIRQYRRAGDRHLEGRALVSQAKLLRDCGRLEESIPLLERASQYLEPDREPRALLALKHNLLMFLAELGRVEDAQVLLPEVRDLAREYATRQDRLRLLWVEGILRKNLGQVELAEEALRQAREGFIAVGIGYDVALVSLDLAALYLESGKTAHVRRLAIETMPIFASRDVQRELLMAWQLFREAAERDVATLRLVDELAARIRRSENTPTAPGTKP